MNTQLALRFVFDLFIAGIAGVFLWMEDAEDTQPGDGRWRGWMDPAILPAVLLIETVIMVFTDREHLLTGWFGGICFNLVAQMSLYFALLLLLLPVLRKHFQARTVSVLWLLPNFLYVFQYSWHSRPAPIFTVPVSEQGLRIWLLVWLTVGALLFLRSFVSHFRFRRRVLRDARPVEDGETLELWKSLQLDSGLRKPRYRLLIAPNTKTPLTVGLMRVSTRVLLPERDYSQEELQLILTHELVHLRRDDVSAKVFYAFARALGWFQPLTWLSMRRSADDLELSCDEAVLLGEDESKRRAYAELLLRTAGDERGFTSCLSANARALKHRLTGVLRPGKKHRGTWLVSLCLFVLLCSDGLAAVRFGGVTVSELLGQEVTVESAAIMTDSRMRMLDTDAFLESGIWEEVLSLNAEKLSGEYTLTGDTKLVMIVKFGETTGSVCVSEQGVSVRRKIIDEGEGRYLPSGAAELLARAALLPTAE